MAVTVEILSQLPLFAALEEDALLDIASHMHERVLSPGQVIILEGDPCRAVYFVTRGIVRTRRMSLEGREQVLAQLGPGEVFNLIPALDGGLNLASVDAVTSTTLYTVPCRRLPRIMTDHQEVVLAVVKHLAAEVRRLSDMVEDLALHTVRTRLARFLLAQADGTVPPQGWTQQEIAARIGTVREMVGRTLRAFADEGLIRRQRGRVAIVNPEGLEREASGAE